ncbi:MAG TPA: site-specific integrase [Sporichthyaceae bacterium]|nr:site-specific integrase [Sporichthyaceae bacterium]
MSMIMRAAVRARMIAFNPCDDVQLPRPASTRAHRVIITREEFFGRLLPAVPIEHRALVGTAGMAGLRWGECVGLHRDEVDLAGPALHVTRTLVEVNGRLEIKPYPKSRSGRPMPPALTSLVRAHQLRSAPNDSGLVFAVRTGSAWRRSNFHRQVWRRALIEAELPRAMRFHDLRHCYATWLVSDNLPINEVQRVLGHEQASTTLDRYTHATTGHADKVRAVFANSADFLLTLGAS